MEKRFLLLFLLWGLSIASFAQVIERRGNRYTADNVVYANSTAFRGYLKNTNPDLFAGYNKGYKMAMTGWGLFAFGVAATPVSTFMLFVNQDRVETDPITGQKTFSTPFPPKAWFGGWVTCVALASTALGASFPLLGVGYHKMHKSVDSYTTRHAGTPQAYWSVELNSDGLGMAYHF